MMELLSGYSTLPEGGPLSSYRYGNEVRVWRYTEALGILRQVVPKAADDPSEVALHSSFTSAATTLAAEGGLPLSLQGTYLQPPGGRGYGIS